MENNQKNFRYQNNNDSKPISYNNFNNYDTNQNKPKEGNWRSKGLESINYPPSSNPISRKPFSDINVQGSNKNFNNYDNSNANYSNPNKYFNR